MAFRLHLVHAQVDAGFERFAQEKFSRLERFFPGEPDINLIIKKEKFQFVIEAKIQSRRSKTFMKTSSNNLNAGLEDLINKLKNHLSKLHDRKHNKKNRTGKIFFSSISMGEPNQEEQT